jgi:nucleoside-diphosphate-sugar epimerase
MDRKSCVTSGMKRQSNRSCRRRQSNSQSVKVFRGRLVYKMDRKHSHCQRHDSHLKLKSGEGSVVKLVTGASGFIGSHLVDDLLARGDSVRALIHSETNAPALRDRGVDVSVGDVQSPESLAEVTRDVEVVYHCAAAVGPGYSRRQIYATNLSGVHNLLQALRETGAARLVFVSTLNVLGTRNLDPATEETPCRRSGDPAADVKIKAEQAVLEAHRTHGLHVAIVRPGAVYGPRDRHNLPKLLSAIRRGKFAYLGSREHVVPLVHVSDLVSALHLAAEKNAARGKTYQITDGSRTAIGELVDLLADLTGAARPTKVLPYLLPYAGCLFFEWLARLRLYRGPAPIARNSLRFLGTSRYVDIRRAREELAYMPRVPFRDGVADTVRWLEEQAALGANALHAAS